MESGFGVLPILDQTQRKSAFNRHLSSIDVWRDMARVGGSHGPGGVDVKDESGDKTSETLANETAVHGGENCRGADGGLGNRVRRRATLTLYSNFGRSNLKRSLGSGHRENGGGAVRLKIHHRVASNRNHARRSASSIQISIKLVVA